MIADLFQPDYFKESRVNVSNDVVERTLLFDCSSDRSLVSRHSCLTSSEISGIRIMDIGSSGPTTKDMINQQTFVYPWRDQRQQK